MTVFRLLRDKRFIAVGATAAVLVAGAYALMSGGGPSPMGHPDATGPTTWSRSALGYAGLFQLLQKLGVPVAASSEGSSRHLGPNAVLVVAEPRTDSSALDDVRAALGAQRVLLVLPKRQGKADSERPNWLRETELLDGDSIEEILHLVDEKASVVRTQGSGPWRAQKGFAEAPAMHSEQLIRSSAIRPILDCEQGILIGEYTRGSRRLIIVADPDLMENHGLSEGDNAVIAVKLIETLLDNSAGEVVFDEFVHGFSEHAFSTLGVLFQFPFTLVTLQAGFALVMLVWAAAAGRFGAALRERAAIDPGRLSLLEAGVRLVAPYGCPLGLTERYFEAVVREVAQHLHAPPGLEFPALLAWLSRTRGIAPVPALPAGSSGQRAVIAAQKLYQWRRETVVNS